jgi:polyisoprenoid-binding protein YceI
MKKLLLLILFSFSCLTVHAADKYVVDPGHTNVGFTVKHLVINKVSGRFKDFSGVIYFDEKDPSQSSITGTIKAESIDTANANRDRDLKGAGFFEVDKFPEITFASKRVEKKGDSYLVSGTLTMHGVSHDVELPVTVTGPIKAMGGKMRIGIETSLTINRQDYGLTWSHAVDGVGLVAGNDVQISINAEAVKEEPAQTQS